MKTASAALAGILIGSVIPAQAQGEQALDIVASAATAKIHPAGTGRRTASIGALSFRFQLRYACPAETEPDSVALTVADSHQRIGGDELDGSAARIELELPAAQTAPVPVIDFCIADAESSPPLTLAAMLTASASLRCVGEEFQQTIYRAAPLDVVLVCAQDADEAAEDG